MKNGKYGCNAVRSVIVKYEYNHLNYACMNFDSRNEQL